MSPLALLTIIALGFASLAIVLWMFLLIHRVVDNRRIRRREAITRQWLQKLLVVLEDPAELKGLPEVRDILEMEAVLGLLRDLAERFRGQYRENLSEVLQHIGAERYAFFLLNHKRATIRVRGCALLAWTGPGQAADERLAELLSDRSANVRLEAGYALAARHASTASLVTLFGALRETDALRSERARDIIRLLAPARSGEIAQLLDQAQTFREKTLLLEGIAASGDLAQSGKVALFLQDPHPAVRSAAVSALEQLADPVHESSVLQLASDADAKVRLKVARYASSMARHNDNKRTLESLARDPDFEVQRIAIYGLVKLGGERLSEFRSVPGSPLTEALIMEALHTSSSLLPALQEP